MRDLDDKEEESSLQLRKMVAVAVATAISEYWRFSFERARRQNKKEKGCGGE